MFLPLMFCCLMCSEVKGDKNLEGPKKRTCGQKKSLQEPSINLNKTSDRLVYPIMANWVADHTFNDILLYPRKDVDLPATSKVVWSLADADMTNGQCAEECMNKEWCSSFFVHLKQHMCILHEVVFLTPDTRGRKVPASGARYFRQVDNLCNFSDGLYRWRDEGLCFKLLPPGTVTQKSATAVRTYCRENIQGRLLKLETARRTAWIRKILLQWKSPNPQSVAVDFVKSDAKIPPESWCKSSSKMFRPSNIIVLNNECNFTLQYWDYDTTFYFLCEKF